MKYVLVILVFVGLKVKELLIDFPGWVWTKHKKELIEIIQITSATIGGILLFVAIVLGLQYALYNWFSFSKDASIGTATTLPLGLLFITAVFMIVYEYRKKIKKFFAANWKKAKNIAGVKSKRKGKRK
jgi:hypothetical protein